MGDEYDRAEEAYWASTAPRSQFSTMYPMIAPAGWTAPADYTDLPAITVNRGGIQFPTQDEGDKMKTSEELISEAENLRLQAARLEEIAEQRAKYGEDPFKNGTVLIIDMKYRGSRRSFKYAALKIGGGYFLTGKVGAGHTHPGADGMTWTNLVAWLAQGDATVWRAKSLEQVL